MEANLGQTLFFVDIDSSNIVCTERIVLINEFIKVKKIEPTVIHKPDIDSESDMNI
jgi:hypothetical protein